MSTEWQPIETEERSDKLGLAEREQIDTGDHVRHNPSGEEWLVAYVRGDKLVCCGWPESMAQLSDCTLTKKASPARRHELLLEMAKSDGSRAAYAKARLSEPEQAAEPVATQPNGLASDMRLAGSGRRFSVRDDGYWIDDDFIFDAQLAVTGDFADEQRVRYAQWICDTLNAADALLPRTEQAHGIGDE